MTLQYKLDNEFELIFVVAFQKILQLSYIDKLLSDVHLEFRDKYKNELTNFKGRNFCNYDFRARFDSLLKNSEDWGKMQATLPKQMRSYDESLKSKKTVASMIERKGEEKPMTKKSVKIVEAKKEDPIVEDKENGNFMNDDVIMANRKKMADKLKKGGKTADKQKSPKSPTERAGKKNRTWELDGNKNDLPNLDRTKDKPEDMKSNFTNTDRMVGQLVGNIKDIEVESEEDDYDYESSSDEDDNGNINTNFKLSDVKTPSFKKSSGIFSMFKGLVGAKNLHVDDMQPALEKLKEHLITKNVAADIALKLCESVSAKLEGRVLGTFDTIAATVKTTLNDALVQILSPKRRVDILRDCIEAKKQKRPYVMAFCGVNGVGKSTNLAKICFWLIENNFNVLIAACDTFRAGAVEQLRTHTRHLNALHPSEKHGGREMVQLYEKGYGKDAAGIAMEAIRHAREVHTDVVLIDTAGRMQDNEPLMRALAKLIKVNEPDLVLFVGEALVGNEAVDQLVKFNQALADYSAMENPHVIDGIVLTKFDTIDDKVRYSDK